LMISALTQNILGDPRQLLVKKRYVPSCVTCGVISSPSELIAVPR
jgi:hypothetical protein